MLEWVAVAFQVEVRLGANVAEKTDYALEEFTKHNPASKKLVSFWNESYQIFSKSLAREIKKVIDEGTRTKSTSGSKTNS